jgi:hypothetical protein
VLEPGGRLGLALEALDELRVLGEAVATLRSSSVSSASQTSAIPPEPILRSSR